MSSTMPGTCQPLNKWSCRFYYYLAGWAGLCTTLDSDGFLLALLLKARFVLTTWPPVKKEVTERAPSKMTLGSCPLAIVGERKISLLSS